jgi:hypothetical protein
MKQSNFDIDIPIVDHRCPRNFPTTDSSKSMESRAAIQHCCLLCRREDVKVYVSWLVTDDDSTTRANLKHSSKETLDAIYGLGN